MNRLNIPSGKDILRLPKSGLTQKIALALLLVITPACASNTSKIKTDFVPNDSYNQPAPQVKKPSLKELIKKQNHIKLNNANVQKLNAILKSQDGFKIKDNKILRFGVELSNIPMYDSDMKLTGVRDSNDILVKGSNLEILQYIENMIYEIMKKQNTTPKQTAGDIMKAESCPEKYQIDANEIKTPEDIHIAQNIPQQNKKNDPVYQAIDASDVPLQSIGKTELEAIAVVESNRGEHPNLMGVMEGTKKSLETIIKKDPNLKEQADTLGPKDKKNFAYNAFLSKLRLQMAEQKAQELTDTDIQKIRMYALNNWKSLRDTARLTLVNKGMDFDAGAFNEFVQAIVDGDREKIVKYFVLRDYNGSYRQDKYAATVLFLAEKVIAKS